MTDARYLAELYAPLRVLMDVRSRKRQKSSTPDIAHCGEHVLFYFIFRFLALLCYSTAPMAVSSYHNSAIHGSLHSRTALTCLRLTLLGALPLRSPPPDKLKFFQDFVTLTLPFEEYCTTNSTAQPTLGFWTARMLHRPL